MITVVSILLAITAVRVGLSAAEKTKTDARAAARLRSVGETMEVAIIALCVVFLVVRPFFAQAFYIPSRSMTPTLQVNDRLIVSKLAYRFGSPRRNDVIVFRAPSRAIGDVREPGETDFVKRVIGLPGDTIEVQAGKTFLNGERLHEAMVAEPPQYEIAPYVVPRGKLFVLGDNRNQSSDSHRWGAIDRSSVIGKAQFIFWPPSRAGRIR